MLVPLLVALWGPGQPTGNSYLVVPGASLGRVRIGASPVSLRALGRPYGGDAAMGKMWATWLGKGNARLDVYTTLGLDRPVVRVVRATSPMFKTVAGIGPGLSEARLRKSYPEAKKIVAYQPPEGGPPVHIFDDIRGGFAFEVRRGKCIAIAVHGKRRAVSAEGVPMALYLAQRLQKG